MNSTHVERVIKEFADKLGHEYNYFDLKEKYAENITYTAQDLELFIEHLIRKGEKINITVLRDYFKIEEFAEIANSAEFPALVFLKEEEELMPILLYRDTKGNFIGFNIQTEETIPADQVETLTKKFVTYENSPELEKNGQIIVITAFPLRYLDEEYYEKDQKDIKLTPLKRLYRLLLTERKDIVYIYVYAIVVGLISLSLPLGIQAIIELIRGGVVFSSIVVLISLVIIGVIITGGLQIMQITLVEILQQRVFAKAAFEFSYRLPRMRSEYLRKYYPPELMNRFFDILTIQKGLPKLLVDITGAIIQILFGLLLLSFYHPFFLVFAILVVGVFFLIFYYTGPKGLAASLKESSYKYKTAAWLQEVGRTIASYRLAGNSNLHLEKMDENVNNYLFYRKKHFKVLVSQFSYIVVFKTLITGGLLVIGTILVVDRQINLGQFVASEVVIILVVTAVEKLIVNMDTIYDLLTAVEKVGKVTDVPLERQDGLKIDLTKENKGLDIHVKDLKYKYADEKSYIIDGLDLDIKAGEKLCIAGASGSGRQTLVRILSGSLSGYEGVVNIGGHSLRDVSVYSIRSVIENNFIKDEIFAGTLLDNITLGRVGITYKDVLWAIESIGLKDYIDHLPEGLYTELVAPERELTADVAHKIALARCVASRPRLLVINDHFQEIHTVDKMKIIRFLEEKENPWTLLVISNDLSFLTTCDHVVFMHKGKLVDKGSYQELLENEFFRNAISEENVLLDILKNVTPTRKGRDINNGGGRDES